jgi:hypothetical protein
MKLEEKNPQKDTQRNRFFTDIPQDKMSDKIPTMRTIFISDKEELREETSSNPCP